MGDALDATALRGGEPELHAATGDREGARLADAQEESRGEQRTHSRRRAGEHRRT